MTVGANHHSSQEIGRANNDSPLRRGLQGFEEVGGGGVAVVGGEGKPALGLFLVFLDAFAGVVHQTHVVATLQVAGLGGAEEPLKC